MSADEIKQLEELRVRMTDAAAKVSQCITAMRAAEEAAMDALRNETQARNNLISAQKEFEATTTALRKLGTTSGTEWNNDRANAVEVLKKPDRVHSRTVR